MATSDRLFEIADSGCSHFNPIVIWQDWTRNGRPVSDEERAALLKQTTSYKTRKSLKVLKLALSSVETTPGCFGLADNLAFVLRKPRE